MSRHGPARTPTRILQLRGSWRANNRPAPAPPPGGPPTCPEWLDDEAKREWERIIPLLAEMGNAAAAYQAVIAIYCCEFAHWQRVRRSLQGDQFAPGTVERSRVVAEANAAGAMMSRLAGKLGLTPADRFDAEAAPDDLPRTDKSRFFDP